VKKEKEIKYGTGRSNRQKNNKRNKKLHFFVVFIITIEQENTLHF
jgi:hypothetical protein